MGHQNIPPKHQRHRLIIICILFIWGLYPIYNFSQAQQKPLKADELINLSNYIYGADDRIAYGKIYAPSNKKVIGHPFFLSEQMKKGTLFLNGLKFKNVNLNYQIVTDQIFYKGENPTITILTNSYIDSLIIEDHILINSDKINITNPMGFMELLFQGHHVSYLKHKVGITMVTTSNSVSTKYLSPKFNLYIKHNNQLISLNTKKRLLSYFDSNKKEISRFMKRNKIKFKKATSSQLLSLLKFCDEFPTN